jgi:hypothetical protein
MDIDGGAEPAIRNERKLKETHLVIMLAIDVQACIGPGAEVATSLNGAAGTLAVADRPVLIDRQLVSKQGLIVQNRLTWSKLRVPSILGLFSRLLRPIRYVLPSQLVVPILLIPDEGSQVPKFCRSQSINFPVMRGKIRQLKQLTSTM